jgi:iron complex outermembrane receptor protein
MGASLAFTPGYTTQQSLTQSLDLSRNRSIDLFAQWVFSRTLSARFSINNLMPMETSSRVVTAEGYATDAWRTGRTNFNFGMEIKL